MTWYRCQNGNGGGGNTAEDYIYNVGSAAFNTGYTHTADTKIVFKAVLIDQANLAGSGFGCVFGARKDGSTYNNAWGLMNRYDNQRKYAFYRSSWTYQGSVVGTQGATNTPFSGKICIFTADGLIMSWYDVDNPSDVHSINQTAGTVNAGIAPLAIFASNDTNTADGWTPREVGGMRLYWFEIYENDILVHRFVPAYNNDQYCLYDEIDEVYKYDQSGYSGLYVLGEIH